MSRFLCSYVSRRLIVSLPFSCVVLPFFLFPSRNLKSKSLLNRFLLASSLRCLVFRVRMSFCSVLPTSSAAFLWFSSLSVFDPRPSLCRSRCTSRPQPHRPSRVRIPHHSQLASVFSFSSFSSFTSYSYSFVSSAFLLCSCSSFSFLSCSLMSSSLSNTFFTAIPPMLTKLYRRKQ